MKKKPLCNAAAVLAALCLPAQPLPASCECVSADLCVQFGSSLLYYSQEACAWYDAAGSLLTDSTEPVQTALYEGAVYTVDLAGMQVTAADGSVNGELTALLPEYLAFRPVSVWEIDGQALDELIAAEDSEAVWAKVREITGTLPLTYRFSSTTEPFYCEISLCGEVIGGMQYSIDAGDTPEAVPWCNENAGCSVKTAYTGMGDLNLNGRNDIADAILLARFLAEDAEAYVSQLGKELADMNSDGFLLADDLGLVLSALAGL